MINDSSIHSSFSVNGISYMRYTYYVPFNVARGLSKIKQYFIELDTGLSLQDKIRASGYDITDFIIRSCYELMSNDKEIALGSGFKLPLNWAVIHKKDLYGRNYFNDFTDLYNYYSPLLAQVHQANIIVDHKYTRSKYLIKMTNNGLYDINNVFSVIVFFTLDILVNCGIDCEPLMSYFTNNVNIYSCEKDNIPNEYFDQWLKAYDKVFINNSNNNSIVKPYVFKSKIKNKIVIHSKETNITGVSEKLFFDSNTIKLEDIKNENEGCIGSCYATYPAITGFCG